MGWKEQYGNGPGRGNEHMSIIRERGLFILCFGVLLDWFERLESCDTLQLKTYPTGGSERRLFQ